MWSPFLGRSSGRTVAHRSAALPETRRMTLPTVASRADHPVGLGRLAPAAARGRRPAAAGRRPGGARPRRRSRRRDRPSPAGVRARRVDAADRGLQRQEGGEVDLAGAPPDHAHERDPAEPRERPHVLGPVGGAHQVEDHVGAAAVGGRLHGVGEPPVRATMQRAPSASTAGALRGAAHGADRPAPRARAATWIAAVPTPLAAACTSRVSPAARPRQAAAATARRSGRPPAPPPRRPGPCPRAPASAGPAGTATRSAYPPPARRAIARSPGAQPATPGPDLAHGARGLEAEDLARARRRRVVALALHEVGAVDGRRRHLEHHLALAGPRVGHLAERAGPRARPGASTTTALTRAAPAAGRGRRR